MAQTVETDKTTGQREADQATCAREGGECNCARQINTVIDFRRYCTVYNMECIVN